MTEAGTISLPSTDPDALISIPENFMFGGESTDPTGREQHQVYWTFNSSGGRTSTELQNVDGAAEFQFREGT